MTSQNSTPQNPEEIDEDVTEVPSRVFDENPIIEVFNKPSNLRVLITLIDAGGVPLTVADISEQAKVGRQTFYNNEDLLLDYGLIEPAGKVGNAQRYKVDLSSDPIQALMALYDAMIDIDS